MKKLLIILLYLPIICSSQINPINFEVQDLLGKETKLTTQPHFYIYDDGTVEKKIIIE